MTEATIIAKPILSRDDFDIYQQIGQGQFGRVYRVVHKASKLTYALKQIPKAKISNEGRYLQLKREIEIQSRLKHKHICQLYTYFQDETHVYMVLEYCKNGTLAEMKKNMEQDTFSDKKIASFFQQLLYAVAFMHERHVMHRDLKLENILLDEDYNIKISDFGCCRHYLKKNTEPRRTFCGTMEYIAPEMIQELPHSHAVDTYCIGIILYELFYMASPFLGVDEAQTFKNIQQKEVQFRDDIRVIPEEAKKLIKRLICKRQEDRPTSKELFDNDFVKTYLCESQSEKKSKRRFTEDCFIKWQQQVGVTTSNQAVQTSEQQVSSLNQITASRKADKEVQVSSSMVKSKHKEEDDIKEEVREEQTKEEYRPEESSEINEEEKRTAERQPYSPIKGLAETTEEASQEV